MDGDERGTLGELQRREDLQGNQTAAHRQQAVLVICCLSDPWKEMKNHHKTHRKRKQPLGLKFNDKSETF